MTKRRKKWLKIILLPIGLGMLWLLSVSILQIFWNHVTIGPDTTFVSGPLEDGNIDYVAAINQHFSQGVTPENNAETLLIRIRPPSSYAVGADVELRTWNLLGAGTPTRDYPEIPKLDADPFHTQNSDKFFERAKAPWTTKDDPASSAYVDLQEKHLALVAEACQRERFWNPAVTPELGDLLVTADQSWGFYRGFANTLAVRAMRRLGEHDFEGYLADVRTLHKLGHLLMQSSSLIGKLVGCAIDSLGTTLQGNAAISGILSKDQSILLLAELRAMPPLPKLAESVNWTERCEVLDAVTRLAAHRLVPTEDFKRLSWPIRPLPIHFDVVLRSTNEWFNRMAAVEDASPTEILAASKRFDDELEEELDSRSGIKVLGYGTNSAQVWAMGVLLPITTRAFQLRDVAIERIRLAQVALALAAWRAEHDTFPASLAELPADLLKGAQRDLFRDADITYQRTPAGFTFYSVGLNTLDDGGKDRNSGHQNADDLALTCPLQPPAQSLP